MSVVAGRGGIGYNQVSRGLMREAGGWVMVIPHTGILRALSLPTAHPMDSLIDQPASSGSCCHCYSAGS